MAVSDLSRPHAFGAALLAAFAEPFIRSTRRRRAARRGSPSLSSLDDRMLKDIGFERADIVAATLGYGGERLDDAASFGRLQSGR